MTGRLSKMQVDHFHREGYLLFRDNVFKPAKFAALQKHFDALLSNWTERRGGRPEHMDMPHMSDGALFDWLFDDDLLDIVESVVGPDIALWSSHFICKPPGDGLRVGWHEDSTYWNTVIQPMDVVTIWLAIDPSTAENGCMRVIPRTHDNGYSRYEQSADRSVFGNEIASDQYDETKAVDCTLAPNQCSLHHAKLIHGSNANTSAIRRCGYTMRYFSTACKFNDQVRNEGRGHEVFLARGKDLAGNVYGEPRKLSKYWKGEVFAVAQ